MRFITGPKKRVTYGFGNNGIASSKYIEVVGHPHTGVDYSNGYGSPVVSDNYGFVYKIIKPEQSPSGWCGVYYLCPDNKYGWVEVCQGHLSRVDVKVGDVVREGQVIGLEGNKGEVYSGGKLVTKAMQESGDRRGHHVHEQFRPVRRVLKVNSKKHYLNRADGRKYCDRQGYYYEIQLDNDTRGCVDPYEFSGTTGNLPKIWVDTLLARVNLYKITK